jgi:hypothetical protein
MLATIRDALLVIVLAPFAGFVLLAAGALAARSCGGLWRWVLTGWGRR